MQLNAANGFNVVIDTAGRLAVDKEMMDEIVTCS
jgi:signal recognition particle GTPase